MDEQNTPLPDRCREHTPGPDEDPGPEMDRALVDEKEQNRPRWLSLRILTYDVGYTKPVPGFDALRSPIDDSQLRSVPLLRLYGWTPTGARCCACVHNIYPYFLILVPKSMLTDPDPEKAREKIRTQLISAFEKRLEEAEGGNNYGTIHKMNNTHLYDIEFVRAVPFYGYRVTEMLFFKVYCFKASQINELVSYIRNEKIFGEQLIPFELQLSPFMHFIVDYNINPLDGMKLSRVFVRELKNNNMGYVEDYLGPTLSTVIVSPLPRSISTDIVFDVLPSDIRISTRKFNNIQEQCRTLTKGELDDSDIVLQLTSKYTRKMARKLESIKSLLLSQDNEQASQIFMSQFKTPFVGTENQEEMSHLYFADPSHGKAFETPKTKLKRNLQKRYFNNSFFRCQFELSGEKEPVFDEMDKVVFSALIDTLEIPKTNSINKDSLKNNTSPEEQSKMIREFVNKINSQKHDKEDCEENKDEDIDIDIDIDIEDKNNTYLPKHSDPQEISELSYINSNSENYEYGLPSKFEPLMSPATSNLSAMSPNSRAQTPLSPTNNGFDKGLLSFNSFNNQDFFNTLTELNENIKNKTNSKMRDHESRNDNNGKGFLESIFMSQRIQYDGESSIEDIESQETFDTEKISPTVRYENNRHYYSNDIIEIDEGSTVKSDRMNEIEELYYKKSYESTEKDSIKKEEQTVTNDIKGIMYKINFNEKGNLSEVISKSQKSNNDISDIVDNIINGKLISNEQKKDEKFWQSFEFLKTNDSIKSFNNKSMTQTMKEHYNSGAVNNKDSTSQEFWSQQYLLTQILTTPPIKCLHIEVLDMDPRNYKNDILPNYIECIVLCSIWYITKPNVQDVDIKAFVVLPNELCSKYQIPNILLEGLDSKNYSVDSVSKDILKSEVLNSLSWMVPKRCSELIMCDDIKEFVADKFYNFMKKSNPDIILTQNLNSGIYKIKEYYDSLDVNIQILGRTFEPFRRSTAINKYGHQYTGEISSNNIYTASQILPGRLIVFSTNLIRVKNSERKITSIGMNEAIRLIYNEEFPSSKLKTSIEFPLISESGNKDSTYRMRSCCIPASTTEIMALIDTMKSLPECLSSFSNTYGFLLYVELAKLYQIPLISEIERYDVEDRIISFPNDS